MKPSSSQLEGFIAPTSTLELLNMNAERIRDLANRINASLDSIEDIVKLADKLRALNYESRTARAILGPVSTWRRYTPREV